VASEEKFVFMVTHGPDDPELATVPFVMAVAALASEIRVTMGFQAEGVRLVERGVADDVQAPEFQPLSKLLSDVLDLGGELLVCTPCLKSRGIPVEALVKGAEAVAAGRFVAEISSASHSLVY